LALSLAEKYAHEKPPSQRGAEKNPPWDHNQCAQREHKRLDCFVFTVKKDDLKSREFALFVSRAIILTKGETSKVEQLVLFYLVENK
jgi:hypothetical protein